MEMVIVMLTSRVMVMVIMMAGVMGMVRWRWHERWEMMVLAKAMRMVLIEKLTPSPQLLSLLQIAILEAFSGHGFSTRSTVFAMKGTSWIPIVWQ